MARLIILWTSLRTSHLCLDPEARDGLARADFGRIFRLRIGGDVIHQQAP
jgi:hypothetical protein